MKELIMFLFQLLTASGLILANIAVFALVVMIIIEGFIFITEWLKE